MCGQLAIANAAAHCDARTACIDLDDLWQVSKRDQITLCVGDAVEGVTVPRARGHARFQQGDAEALPQRTDDESAARSM